MVQMKTGMPISSSLASVETFFQVMPLLTWTTSSS
jgi:hypothetical protein